MDKDKPAQRVPSRRDTQGGSERTEPQKRKLYTKPTITFCEPMVNVTLFSAGAAPNSQNPFIPAS